MNGDLPKTSPRAGAAFRLAEFEVHPQSGEIRGRRGVERLRPLLMDVLLRLAEKPGEVVRRETLLEEVWPRRMVNDEVLSRAIAELRTALGDDARKARYIETLPKIGYRLVASVEALAQAGAVAPAAAPGPRSRIAAWIGALAIVAVLGAGALALRVGPVPGSDLGVRLAQARPFTSEPGLEVGPRFSPDGQRIAYASGEGSQSRIVIQSLDGTQRRSVGEPGALLLSPAFFPDARRIAYWHSRDGDCAIVEHDLDSGATRALLDCARAPRSRFDLSPDGKRIVFTGLVRAQYPAGLLLADVATGAVQAFTSPEPGLGDDLHPRFSPDGKRVAFFRGSESHRQLWIAEVADAATARPAARAEGLSYGAAWLGAEGPLLVAADWFGFRALNLVELPAGQARLLGARGARFPDVSAQGDVIYENATYSANLWMLDTRPGAEDRRLLWPSTRYTNQAEFSPDGKQVAFASNREGLGSIFVAAPDGEPRLLAPSTEYMYMRPHWSADGRAIHAVRLVAGPARPTVQQAVRIELDGARVSVLEELGKSVNDVRESRDGRWLFVAEASGHAMRLFRTEAARPGKLERLALPLMSEYHVNAERLVFAQPQLSGLTSCRLEGLTCEPLDLAIGDGNRYDWALGERSIFFRLAGGEAPQIARYDLAESRLTWRSPFAPTGFGGSIAVAPGEARLLVSREERTAIDLMLVRK